MEFVGPRGRLFISSGLNISFSLVGGTLPWFAWWLRDWKALVMITSFPLFLVPVVLYLFVPESVRWLASKGKLQEAATTLQKIAKFNGHELSNEVLEKANFTPRDDHVLEVISIRHVFRYRRFLINLVAANLIWMLLNISYTGGNTVR